MRDKTHKSLTSMLYEYRKVATAITFNYMYAEDIVLLLIEEYLIVSC